MDESEIDRLFAIMVKRHGKGAEAMARKRALRCKRMAEDAWAAIWSAVADRIAQTALARRPSRELAHEPALPPRLR